MSVKRKIIKIIEHKYTPYVILCMILFIMLSPLILMFLTSFKTPEETLLWPPTILPHTFTLDAFREVIFHSTIPLAIRNSLIITLSTVAIVTVASTLTAYGLSRYKYRGSGAISYALLATRVIPPISLTIPFFVLFSKMGLIDTFTGLIILNTYLTYPIVTLLLKNSFNNFPSELVDSARVDGASKNRTFLKVVLPPMKIAIAAGAIITFLFTWNEFLFAMVFTQSAMVSPLTVGIFQFVGDEAIEWTSICAVGVIASLPSIIFFIIAQRYIVRGLTAGAVKGAA